MCEYVLNAIVFTIIKLYRQQRYSPTEKEQDDGVRTILNLLSLIILSE